MKQNNTNDQKHSGGGCKSRFLSAAEVRARAPTGKRRCYRGALGHASSRAMCTSVHFRRSARLAALRHITGPRSKEYISHVHERSNLTRESLEICEHYRKRWIEIQQFYSVR